MLTFAFDAEEVFECKVLVALLSCHFEVVETVVPMLFKQTSA